MNTKLERLLKERSEIATAILELQVDRKRVNNHISQVRSDIRKKNI